jgi:hypothetical protein
LFIEASVLAGPWQTYNSCRRPADGHLGRHRTCGVRGKKRLAKNCWTYNKERGGFGNRVNKKWFDDHSMVMWNKRMAQGTREENSRYDLRMRIGGGVPCDAKCACKDCKGG